MKYYVNRNIYHNGKSVKGGEIFDPIDIGYDENDINYLLNQFKIRPFIEEIKKTDSTKEVKKVELEQKIEIEEKEVVDEVVDISKIEEISKEKKKKVKMEETKEVKKRTRKTKNK